MHLLWFPHLYGVMEIHGFPPFWSVLLMNSPQGPTVLITFAILLLVKGRFKKKVIQPPLRCVYIYNIYITIYHKSSISWWTQHFLIFLPSLLSRVHGTTGKGTFSWSSSDSVMTPSPSASMIFMISWRQKHAEISCDIMGTTMGSWDTHQACPTISLANYQRML